MDSTKLNIFEIRALLAFLEDYVNKDSLSIYDGALPRHLFLAYIKLQKAKAEWEEAMAYSD